jgi:hypothetical protein
MSVLAKGAREPTESTVKAVLEGHDCGFFRNPRGLSTMELVLRGCAACALWWHKRCSLMFEEWNGR